MFNHFNGLHYTIESQILKKPYYTDYTDWKDIPFKLPGSCDAHTLSGNAAEVLAMRKPVGVTGLFIDFFEPETLSLVSDLPFSFTFQAK